MLVLVAALFNLVLCFIGTQHWLTVDTTTVILIELSILACGLYAIRMHVSREVVETSGVLTLYLIGIKFINPGLDLKILHDLAITYIFYKLGTLSTVEQGSRLIWTIMLVVLAVGSFELFLPNLFGDVFDVWGYYVNKGALGQDVVDYAHSNLFVSGFRGNVEARMFFPGLLGTHRVSSIFLEPVSMGNFATIVFAWCLSISGPVRGRQFLLAFLAFVCIVVSDSRFGAGCCIIMLLCRFMPVIQSRFIVFLLPVLAVLGLTIMGSIRDLPGVHPSILEDDFAGRLLFSARLLNYWNLSQWFALAPSQVYTADTGYAYVINSLGLPVCVLLQAAFAAYAVKNREALILKFLIAIYFATSLCIGESVFSVKTAGLLWFLYGTTNATAAPNRWLPSPMERWRPAGGIRAKQRAEPLI